MSPIAEHTGARETYELAYDEAVLGLTAQQGVIDNLRGRAGLLLSGAAIATSFLGGQALRTGEPALWTWIAIGAFLQLGVATLTILWPRGWTYDVDPADIVDYAERPDPVPFASIRRDVALHRGQVLEENGGRLRRLIWAFRIAGLLLVGEIVAWTVDLATRVD